jgi:hypothetical protein
MAIKPQRLQFFVGLAALVLAYVLLASAEGSYMSGALIPVTGCRPML